MPMCKAGEVLTTLSGRVTAPFPRVDTSTNRRATNTVRRVQSWLMAEAASEAEARGNDFASELFSAAQSRPTQADLDLAHDCLFGALH